MRQIKLKSKYKEDENFDYMSAPKHFESVTNRSIERLRHYCVRMNEEENRGKWVPSALESMLVSVLGRFGIAHAKLEGDFSSRRSNLINEYVAGVADVEERLINLENSILEHNLLFEQYREAYERFTEKTMKGDLRYSEDESKKLRAKFEKISKEIGNEH